MLIRQMSFERRASLITVYGHAGDYQAISYCNDEGYSIGQIIMTSHTGPFDPSIRRAGQRCGQTKEQRLRW